MLHCTVIPEPRAGWFVYQSPDQRRRSLSRVDRIRASSWAECSLRCRSPFFDVRRLDWNPDRRDAGDTKLRPRLFVCGPSCDWCANWRAGNRSVRRSNENWATPHQSQRRLSKMPAAVTPTAWAAPATSAGAIAESGWRP